MDKDFEKEVLERLTRIETKLDDYDNIKTKAEEARSKAYSNEARMTIDVPYQLFYLLPKQLL